MHECYQLSARYDIVGITSCRESFYAATGKLCQHFGLPGPNPTSVERCCDKFTRRQILAEAGVPMPAYRLALNATDVKRSAAQIGLPVIVKPAVGIGSEGVRLCRDIDEIADRTHYLLGGKYRWQSSPRILVEEFAQGPHYSIEMMGTEIIGIAAADFGHPPHFVCREYIYPALLTDEEHKRIAEISLTCLQALGLGWGPKNIDLRWTKRGPVVIEVNPRLAGTPASQLVKLAYGEHISQFVVGRCIRDGLVAISQSATDPFYLEWLSGWFANGLRHAPCPSRSACHQWPCGRADSCARWHHCSPWLRTRLTRRPAGSPTWCQFILWHRKLSSLCCGRGARSVRCICERITDPFGFHGGDEESVLLLSSEPSVKMYGWSSFGPARSACHTVL